ncbi:MAG: hypothetical protein HKP61_01150, partial [Dactylosporangium sp.]|nr:hypothetical protein [Dactylosporangium sp.]NNJ59576.1 hypothetical protein [Dactylosporangium sp.]
MSSVIVLAWNSERRELRFLPINGGSGGTEEVSILAEESAAGVGLECEATSLPRVGEFVSEAVGAVGIDETTCLLELSGPAATRYSAKRKDRSRIRLTDQGTGVPRTEVSPVSVGLDDDDVEQLVQKALPFWLFATPIEEEILGCWEVEGGLGGWRERRCTARAAKAREESETSARKAEREAAEEAKHRFVNPYTFVPLPTTIGRRAPAGHGALDRDRLSGTFRVRW